MNFSFLNKIIPLSVCVPWLLSRILHLFQGNRLCYRKFTILKEKIYLKIALLGVHLFNPISARGGGVFRTPSNFAAFGDPLKVKYIEMFHADFSYLCIY